MPVKENIKGVCLDGWMDGWMDGWIGVPQPHWLKFKFEFHWW